MSDDRLAKPGCPHDWIADRYRVERKVDYCAPGYCFAQALVCQLCGIVVVPGAVKPPEAETDQ